jgi:hypothetical protein
MSSSETNKGNDKSEKSFALTGTLKRSLYLGPQASPAASLHVLIWRLSSFHFSNHFVFLHRILWIRLLLGQLSLLLAYPSMQH